MLLETRSQAQKPAHKDLDRNGQTRAITVKAAYASVSNRGGSRSCLKRVCHPRNLRVRTLTAMAKPGPSRSRPLTLRFLTGVAHALLEIFLQNLDNERVKMRKDSTVIDWDF